jgi:hypothetical protein
MLALLLIAMTIGITAGCQRNNPEQAPAPSQQPSGQ